MSAQTEKQDHSNHRDRVKNLILKDGAADLSEAVFLEALLYYAVPRVDTLPMAKALLERFGSIEGILNAEQGDISQINGLKDNAEVFFILLRELLSRSHGMRAEPSLLNPEFMRKYLLELYRNAEAETVYAFYFSRHGEYLGKKLIYIGDMNSARFSLRTVTEGVINAGGNGVILSHNHPSEVLAPSQDDIISTKRMAAHLAANEIELIEHYIVGKNSCVGFYKESLNP